MGHLLIVSKMRQQVQEMRNTFWFGGDDATHANAQDIVDEIADAYRDELAPNLVNDWSLYGFDVYDKTIEGAPGIDYAYVGGAIAGASAAAGMPTQICMRVDFKASVPKPNTNRKFLPGWPSTGILDTGFFSSGNTAFADAWAQRLLDLPTVTTLAVVLEVVALSSETGTVIASNPLTFFRSVANPSSLRKRKIGVGI